VIRIWKQEITMPDGQVHLVRMAQGESDEPFTWFLDEPKDNEEREYRRVLGEIRALNSAWLEDTLQRTELAELHRLLAPPKVARKAIPRALRQAIYDRDGHLCLHCGTTERLSLDHIIPWSKGGPDTYENLQTLCRSCNSRKHARVLVAA